MIWDFAHLSCKVEKMDILQKSGLSTLSDESENIFHNVRSLFPLESGKKTVIRHSLMLAQTVISLRHETYNPEHYAKLHPPILSAAHRQQCLWDLKDIGYQVGTGFMVGAPFQTPEYLAEDMQFLKELNPHMVGIGPFIPHHDTPFADQPAGTLELTLYMLGLIRLMLPKYASGYRLRLDHSPKGRELGILAGANVVMPNLSPTEVRKDYLLYDNKICTGDESAQCRHCLERRMASVGYQVVTSRGDSLNI